MGTPTKVYATTPSPGARPKPWMLAPVCLSSAVPATPPQVSASREKAAEVKKNLDLAHLIMSCRSCCRSHCAAAPISSHQKILRHADSVRVRNLWSYWNCTTSFCWNQKPPPTPTPPPCQDSIYMESDHEKCALRTRSCRERPQKATPDDPEACTLREKLRVRPPPAAQPPAVTGGGHTKPVRRSWFRRVIHD